MTTQENIAFLTYHLSEYIVNNSDYEEVSSGKHARGGFATVTKVKSKKDGKYYARKNITLSNHVGHTQKYVYREVLALAKTDCDSLCKLRGFSIADDKKTAFIYMDFFDGGSLASYIIDDGSNFDIYQSLQPNELTVIAYGVALGCMRFHDLGFIHRDIKPQNIMIQTYEAEDGTERKEPVIIDFGASREYDPETNEMTKIVSKGYAAPEVSDSMGMTATYSNSIDVFSYGRVLFTMVECVSPDEAISDNHLRYGQNPPITSDIPKELKKLIEDCQDTDPEKRPTFEDIVKMFREDMIYFDDDKREECLDYLHEYMSRVDPNYEHSMDSQCEENEEEEDESKFIGVNKLAPFIEYYQREGKEITEDCIDAIIDSFTLEETEELVTSIRIGIAEFASSTVEIDWDIMGIYYLFMKKIILRGHEYAERAARIDIHDELVLVNEEFADSIFTILVNILNFTPNKLSAYFLIYYLTCNKNADGIKNVAFLYSMFIRNADKDSSEYQDFVNAFVSSYKIESKKIIPSKEFFKFGLVEEYFQCLLCLDEFDENIIEGINNRMISYILGDGSENVEYVHSLYKFIFAVKDKARFEISVERIMQDLNSDSILKYDAISYIAAFSPPVDFNELYPILEKTAPFHTASVYLLIGYINDDDERAETILKTWKENSYSKVPIAFRFPLVCAVISNYGPSFACKYKIVTTSFLDAINQNYHVDKIVSSLKCRIVPNAGVKEDDIKKISVAFDSVGFWDKITDVVLQGYGTSVVKEFLFVAKRISKVLPIPAFVKIIKKTSLFKNSDTTTAYLTFLQNYMQNIKALRDEDLFAKVEETGIFKLIKKDMKNAATDEVRKKILDIYNEFY